MHYAVLVSVVECVVDLLRDGDRVLHTELLFSVEAISERLSLHVGHHVEHEPVSIPGIVKREDMRVLELRRRLDFGEESLAPNDCSQLRLEHLQRDFALVLQVVGQVDRRHPTFA